jgi:hypothetical protein
VHDELGVNSFHPDERLSPELSDEASRTRDIVGIERITNGHEEVEPNLCTGGDEDRSPTASSPDELGTDGGCRDLVDRGERLRTPKYHGGPIRIAKGRKAALRLRGDDEIARS